MLSMILSISWVYEIDLPYHEYFIQQSHSGPTEVEDCSLPPPNMADTKTGEQGKA